MWSKTRTLGDVQRLLEQNPLRRLTIDVGGLSSGRPPRARVSEDAVG
jgi:hypothetical protein